MYKIPPGGNTLENRQEEFFMRRNVIISRIALLIAAILWVFTAFNFFFHGNGANEESIILAFTNASLLDTSARVYCVGELDKKCSSQQDKEALLKNIAAEFGISTYRVFTQSEESAIKTILNYSGENTTVVLSFICAAGEDGQEKQYLSMEINTISNVTKSLQYKEKMEEILELNNINSVVRLYLQGSVRGDLKLETRNDVADALLKDINAKVVQENRDMDCYNIYAYTKSAGSYVWVEGERVNINLSMNYNELNDRTYIYLALPMNNQDF